AAEAGMKMVNMPYSGSYEFVETEMYWPINHMVAPASQALQCADCHTQSETGRLAKLEGFYLPGRDHHKGLDRLGIWMIWLAVGGVLLHTSIRVYSHLKQQEDLEMQYPSEEDNHANG
ncbi:hypothetical protein RZS08_18065, partial [Arthrospira platensis SPKY1]|nr:hypothetical protein [Arthrospira platensis SPKY1]